MRFVSANISALLVGLGLELSNTEKLVLYAFWFQQDFPWSRRQTAQTPWRRTRHPQHRGAPGRASAITVSRYFNQPEQVSPERRERIAAVVAELGHAPNLVAGGLASARGRIVAMVIPNISGRFLPIRSRASATPSVATGISCCWRRVTSAPNRKKARCARFSAGRRQRWRRPAASTARPPKDDRRRRHPGGGNLGLRTRA